MRTDEEFDYDVCLSFAGEDREYVEKVADICISKGVRVFYDRYESVSLWGKDLYEHLDDIYRNCANYCVMFISKSYAKKVWTSHERKSAQTRAFRENKEYILPARFDDTEIPGLRETIGYVDIHNITPEKLAVLLLKKLGPRPRKNYFPPDPDILYKRLGVRSTKKKEAVSFKAEVLFNAFKRMTQDERHLIFNAFLDGCVGDLPANTHVYLDLLRRSTGFGTQKIKRLLGALRPLGFYSKIEPSKHHDKKHLGSDLMVYIEFHVLTEKNGGPATDIAMEMITGAIYAADIGAADYCRDCAYQLLMDLNFSQLSSATLRRDLFEVHDKHS